MMFFSAENVLNSTMYQVFLINVPATWIKGYCFELILQNAVLILTFGQCTGLVATQFCEEFDLSRAGGLNL